MKNKFKKVLGYFLNDTQIHILRMRIAKLITFKKDIMTDFELDSWGDASSDTFFGYYDISPFNAKATKIIYLTKKLGNNTVDVVMADLRSGDISVLANTKAWNWQQGSRLRWLNENQIVFNDYRYKKYVAVILDINTKTENILDWPLYDLDNSGN